MTSIKDVTYDATSETVRLGMGNRWGDVYAALDRYKRTVVGGRIAPVGMALITGGKFPCFSFSPSCSIFNLHHPPDTDKMSRWTFS